MSNELETLEKLAYENACCRCQYYNKKGCSLSYRSNERSCFWLDIEKELEALEIIKRKRVDVYKLSTCFEKGSLERYNSDLEMSYFRERHLTQEQFDVLKEVLKDE